MAHEVRLGISSWYRFVWSLQISKMRTKDEKGDSITALFSYLA